MRYKSEEMKEKIISSVESFFLTHHRTPTITELTGLAGLSRGRVYYYLKELDQEGRILYDGKRLETPVTRKASPEVDLSPILGTVACGQPQYAEENFESYVALPTIIFGDDVRRRESSGRLCRKMDDLFPTFRYRKLVEHDCKYFRFFS